MSTFRFMVLPKARGTEAVWVWSRLRSGHFEEPGRQAESCKPRTRMGVRHETHWIHHMDLLGVCRWIAHTARDAEGFTS